MGLEDDPLGYVERVDRRIEDVTGLTMETAEQLQVVNYGIGGHYEPHYDFARVRWGLEDVGVHFIGGEEVGVVCWW